MKYIDYSNYSAKRIYEMNEVDTQNRIKVFTAFQTVFSETPDSSLNFQNVKFWYQCGYITSKMLSVLVENEILTQAQAENITESTSYTFIVRREQG